MEGQGRMKANIGEGLHAMGAEEVGQKAGIEYKLPSHKGKQGLKLHYINLPLMLSYGNEIRVSR